MVQLGHGITAAAAVVLEIQDQQVVLVHQVMVMLVQKELVVLCLVLEVLEENNQLLREQGVHQVLKQEVVVQLMAAVAAVQLHTFGGEILALREQPVERGRKAMYV